MDYSEIYFAIASISTIIVAGLILLVFIYILSILYDVKRLSKIAKKEAEIIAKGFEKSAGIFGAELSNETAAFVKTVFALLLSYFAPRKTSITKRKLKV
ncbi:MAG TPA: hypothetical protein VJB58_00780 [Candidatus Paceibacterota bacterium]